MRVKHNGVEKEITHVSQLPLLGLGTTHLFELMNVVPRVVYRVRKHTDVAGYAVTRVMFRPEPNPDCEKDTVDYDVVATREGVWAIITGGKL